MVNPARWVLVRLIRVYQRFISPLMPPMCRFYPSCSQYAVEALERRPVFVALGKIIWRIVRCNPLSAGGYDPVDCDNSPPEHPVVAATQNEKDS